MCGLVVILGLGQAILYYKYSTVIPYYSRLKTTKLFITHIVIHVFLLLLAPIKTFVVVYEIQDGTFYSYQILDVFFTGQL